jgi:beta-mannosidase
LYVFYWFSVLSPVLTPVQTLLGHPIAWVNNQFQQYTFDVSSLIASPAKKDNNLTVAFESAWYYGLNVTARPDAEFFPGQGVRTSDNVSIHSMLISKTYLMPPT